MAETTIELLAAERECKRLVLLAAALVDAGNYEDFAALFTADGELVRPGGNALKGREAIVASYRQRPAERMTRHLVFEPLVTQLAPDQAEAVTAVLLWSGNRTDAAGPFGRPARERQVVGQFADQFVLTKEGWRVARRTAHFELFHELA